MGPPSYMRSMVDRNVVMRRIPVCRVLPDVQTSEGWEPYREFILVINQIDAQNVFHNKFISCLYMFRAPCAYRQEVKIVLYSLWYHHNYRCDDARGCIIQFWPPDDEHMVLETCRGMK